MGYKVSLAMYENEAFYHIQMHAFPFFKIVYKLSLAHIITSI